MIYQYFAERGGLPARSRSNAPAEAGWRFVVLFHKGRKWLKAVDTATLETYRLPVSQLGHFVPYQMNRRTLASRLRKRRDALRRCHLRFSERAVKAAITKLSARQQ